MVTCGNMVSILFILIFFHSSTEKFWNKNTLRGKNETNINMFQHSAWKIIAYKYKYISI